MEQDLCRDAQARNDLALERHHQQRADALQTDIATLRALLFK